MTIHTLQGYYHPHTSSMILPSIQFILHFSRNTYFTDITIDTLQGYYHSYTSRILLPFIQFCDITIYTFNDITIHTLQGYRHPYTLYYSSVGILTFNDITVHTSRISLIFCSTKSKCTFTHCVPSLMVVVSPAISLDIQLSTFSILYPAFKPATKMLAMKGPGEDTANVSVVYFESQEAGQITHFSPFSLQMHPWLKVLCF